MNCKNCNTETDSNYCPSCGQPAILKRIDGRYLIHETEQLFHVERGFLYTVKELITRPGRSIRTYLSENRNRLVKPITFIIVTSLIYTLCNHYFHFEDGYVKYAEAKETAVTAIFEWIQSHYGYANILMGVFIALWTKLFFKKHTFNVFEILILLCFVMGMGMLIFSVLGILQALTHINLMQIAGIAGFVYTTWAIGQFFGKDKISNYIKAFFAYLVGMLTFMLAAILLGILIEIIIH